MKFHKFAILLTVTLLINLAMYFALPTLAQQTKKAYELTEIQELRLKVRYKDAQLAQKDFAAAQAHFQQTIADYNAEVKKTEQDNSWPDNLVIDTNTWAVSEPPPAPANPAPPTPANPPEAK